MRLANKNDIPPEKYTYIQQIIPISANPPFYVQHMLWLYRFINLDLRSVMMMCCTSSVVVFCNNNSKWISSKTVRILFGQFQLKFHYEEVSRHTGPVFQKGAYHRDGNTDRCSAPPHSNLVVFISIAS